MSIFEQSIETGDSGMCGGISYYNVEELYQEFKERLIKELQEEKYIGHHTADCGRLPPRGK